MIKETIKKLTDIQKYSLILSAISLLLLLFSFFEFVELKGYFMFLRIITCGTMILLCCEKTFPIPWKCIMILSAVLYNPFFNIIDSQRDVYSYRTERHYTVFESSGWFLFNVVTIVLLVAAWGYFVKKNYRKKNYDIHSLSKKYKPYTIREFITVLKPKSIKNAFSSPKEVKQYLDSIEFDEATEEDAWIFYCLAEKSIKEQSISEEEKKQVEHDNNIVQSLIQWLKETGKSELDYRHISNLEYHQVEIEALVYLSKEFAEDYFDSEDAHHYLSEAICCILKEKGTLEKTLRPKREKRITSNGITFVLEVDDEEDYNGTSSTR